MTMGSLDWGDFGGSPFDDLFERFFSGHDPCARTRRIQQVDLTQRLNEQARELLARAARQAAAWGSPDLDALHLLWAATQLPATRKQLQQAGANVDALAKRIQETAGRGSPGEQVNALSSAAKRVLLDALA